MTGAPEALVMWTSYTALPSVSVSARTTLPPATLASAAAEALASVSPVRASRLLADSRRGAVGPEGAGLVVMVVLAPVAVFPDAALAIP